MKLSVGMIIAIFTLWSSGFAQMGPGGHGSGFTDMTGYSGMPLEHNLVLPQLAVGPDITTSVVLLNWGSNEMMPWLTAEQLKTTGRILFFDSTGSPLTVRINDTDNQSVHEFSLDALQMIRLNLTSPDSGTKVGWALIEVDGDISDQSPWGMMGSHPIMRGERLIASETFTVKQGSQLRSEVGVIPSMFERSLFLNSALPANANADGETGVAIVNTGATSATITLKLRKADGSTVGEKQITLPAGNQTAQFVRELFESAVPANFDGYLQVSSTSEGVIVLGILVNQGVLTAIPTQHTGAMAQQMM